MGARDLLADLAGLGVTVTAHGDRLVIRPASRLTDGHRAELREAKAELLAILGARACADCAHQTRRRTCREPVRAGLVDSFGIVFLELLPADQAAQCPAFSVRVH